MSTRSSRFLLMHSHKMMPRSAMTSQTAAEASSSSSSSYSSSSSSGAGEEEKVDVTKTSGRRRKCNSRASLGRRKMSSLAPPVPPPSDDHLSLLHALFANNAHVAVLTGAGCSTESNIPDYRSPSTGAYSRGHKPMTHQQFMATEKARRRYWSRSYAGWAVFSASRPNEAHAALARLERDGYVSSLITQNVDRLHAKAGSEKVTEIHGTTHEVMCMSCGDITTRESFQGRLEEENSFLKEMEAEDFRGVPYGGGSEEEDSGSVRGGGGAATGGGGSVRPDGDVDITAEWEQRLVIPSCSKCGGILKVCEHILMHRTSICCYLVLPLP